MTINQTLVFEAEAGDTFDYVVKVALRNADMNPKSFLIFNGNVYVVTPDSTADSLWSDFHSKTEQVKA